jgi:hypothetical protein
MSATIKVPGTELAQALYNVALFACKDDTLPVLCGVALDYTDKGLSVVATDRYTMARQELPADATEVTCDAPGLVTLDMPTAKQLWSVKGSGYAAPPVITVDDSGAATITCPNGMTLTSQGTDSRFPNWRTIWNGIVKDCDGQDKPGATTRGQVRFTAAYIARFAKVKGSDAYMTMTSAESKRHTMVTCGPLMVAMMQVTIPGS